MLRFRSLFALLGLSVGIFSAATARCADISVDNRSIQNLTVVFVVGALNEGDAEVFRKRVAPLSRAAVFLESEGGNLLAGIQLGEAIRLKGFSTAVTGICASACALAWLGGQPRFMTPVASVGFHAASINQRGQVSETGIGNALVGAYLTRIGLSYSTVAYVTQASPSSMTWLTVKDASQHGIEVSVLEGAEPAATADCSSIRDAKARLDCYDRSPAKSQSKQATSDQRSAKAQSKARLDPLIEEAREHVGATLDYPQFAEFSGLRRGITRRTFEGKTSPTICGSVAASSVDGVSSGYRYFVYLPDQEVSYVFGRIANGESTMATYIHDRYCVGQK